ncbi:DNA-3-methyladenine glycosylase family protein [Stackebrandtia nassauensis]|uniref:DNA-3-methyladenine glycosylase II n=1 Tax=Stackebrandtia nassauensis (strain DSM 44728 / CIP 108903 / NRRL B-16338 / NBRC 102104 / LLR-40K-21) TaxID=446470 RepID=D3Q9E3_STANL|nr:DNA-3-methyladenine glycosylase [Stackebrandtia nassauensis]ADD42625.1 HhH-GPD family protein [Stackebrandtia nassauensis DSM 44728]
MTTINPAGPFNLATSTRFLEGFAPAAYEGAGDEVLRLAFPADDGKAVAGAALRQETDGTVRVEITGAADAEAVGAQVRRIMSLDIDGTGYPAVVASDPIVKGLSEQYPGLRPVCFHSPYEAAAWAVIGHRIRITQAAGIKAAMAARLGETVTVAGRPVAAFPTPEVLAEVGEFPGLTDVKIARLRGIAEAALAGELDAKRLRDMASADALEQLQGIAGIGPFSAELILIRGAGHPDVFPRTETRLHRTMTQLYRREEPSAAELADIAADWAPFRSWVGVLLRVHREAVTGEIARGRAARA